MKKLLLFLSVATIFFTSCAPRVYKNRDFDAITASHKIVAILPAEVDITLRPNEMKKITPEQLKESEEQTGFNIQDKMYAWFLRKSDRRRYTVSFQDVNKTNALLLQNGIKYGDMRSKTKEELARLLGVDAVITTKAIMRKPMSEGAAVALGVLLGTWGNTNDVQVSITINEGKKGDLVWKYDYNNSGSFGSTAENLVDGLMRNASKRFPYNDR